MECFGLLLVFFIVPFEIILAWSISICAPHIPIARIGFTFCLAKPSDSWHRTRCVCWFGYGYARILSSQSIQRIATTMILLNQLGIALFCRVPFTHSHKHSVYCCVFVPGLLISSRIQKCRAHNWYTTPFTAVKSFDVPCIWTADKMSHKLLCAKFTMSYVHFPQQWVATMTSTTTVAVTAAASFHLCGILCLQITRFRQLCPGRCTNACKSGSNPNGFAIHSICIVIALLINPFSICAKRPGDIFKFHLNATSAGHFSFSAYH